MFEVTDTSYHGREMRDDSDSHYARVDAHGSLIPHSVSPYFEEFVVKHGYQIYPLYIVGLREVNRFVIWRDVKIARPDNASLFKKLKKKYNFNIYGSEATADALAILQCKLTTASPIQCIVVTNGADEGNEFSVQCRQIRPTIPIVVYCMNLEHHQRWASTMNEPRIKVTVNSNDVFDFIDDKFGIHH